MMIPTLDQVISAYECYDDIKKSSCSNCPYGYGRLEDWWDSPSWGCNNEKLEHDMLGYLKLYQYLSQNS